MKTAITQSKAGKAEINWTALIVMILFFLIGSYFLILVSVVSEKQDEICKSKGYNYFDFENNQCIGEYKVLSNIDMNCKGHLIYNIRCEAVEVKEIEYKDYREVKSK